MLGVASQRYIGSLFGAQTVHHGNCKVFQRHCNWDIGDMPPCPLKR